MRSFRFQLIVGIACLVGSLVQLLVLKQAHFYTLFSVGMSVLLGTTYNRLSSRRLFTDWRPTHVLAFFLALFGLSVVIDRIGLYIGYWEYPHYEAADEVLKYLFEWAIALFYHLLALLIGVEILKRWRIEGVTGFVLGLLLLVTPVGLLTESLNIQVYSWRVVSMPISNYRIGGYFLVFQTIGYWLMAIIPYALFAITNRFALSAQGSTER